jgi:hypothetical protein
VTARLIVRRVRRLAPPGQTELGPAWRYHAVFTDNPLLHTAEADQRDHAMSPGTGCARPPTEPACHAPPAGAA